MSRTTLIHRHVTVHADELLVEHVDGRFQRVLEPGRHRRARRATYRSVGTREQLATTAAQEVTTSDGVPVRATVAVRWGVGDPLVYVERADDPDAVVYLATQLALRSVLAEVSVDDLAAADRAALGARMTALVTPAAAGVGVVVHEVHLKDVVLPPDVRAAYAEQLVARLRGQARLEAARAETAALRALANGAKLLDEHPALARLRTVEALPHGSTVELRA